MKVKINGIEANAVRKIVGQNGTIFYELEKGSQMASFFHDIVSDIKEHNPNGKAVTLKEPEEYAELKNFVTGDGKSVFSIAPNGDIESLASYPRMGRGPELAQTAANIGNRLDCYAIPNAEHPSGYLVDLYGQAGFNTIASVDINPDYDDTNGRASHVAVMAKGITVDKVKHFDMNGYDDAIAYRDKIMDAPISQLIPKTKEAQLQKSKEIYELAVKHGMPTLDQSVKVAVSELAQCYKKILTEAKGKIIWGPTAQRSEFQALLWPPLLFG